MNHKSPSKNSKKKHAGSQVINSGFPSKVGLRIARDDFFRMGYFYHQTGDLQAAAEYYIKSIETEPSAEGHTFLARVLSQLGDLDGAIQECKFAVKLDPDFGNAWNDLGAYLLEKRKLPQASRALKKALIAKGYETPELPHFNLAKYYLAKGMLLYSIRELRRTLKLNPEYAPARELLDKVEIQLM